MSTCFLIVVMIGRPKGNFLAIQEGSDMDSAIHVRTSRCSVESDNLPARATGPQDTAADKGKAQSRHLQTLNATATETTIMHFAVQQERRRTEKQESPGEYVT